MGHNSKGKTVVKATTGGGRATITDVQLLAAVGTGPPDAARRVYAVTGITAGTTQTQAGGTLLAGEYNNVTTVATASDGVRLPSAAVGGRITVRNSGASVLRVWPFLGDAIASLAANLSVDLPVKGEMTFVAIDATTWKMDEVLTLQSPTTLTGSLQVKAAASAGNTVTQVTNASQAAARTYTIPDAGASASFVMSTGAQTNATATSAEIAKLAGVPASVIVTVTTPGASGTCDCAFTFKDAAGATCAFATSLQFYLSGVDGLTLTAAITGILVADTPVGAVGVVTTGQQGMLVTTAAGLASVKLSGSAATTYYLTFRGLGGRLFTSPALLTKA